MHRCLGLTRTDVDRGERNGKYLHRYRLRQDRRLSVVIDCLPLRQPNPRRSLVRLVVCVCTMHALSTCAWCNRCLSLISPPMGQRGEAATAVRSPVRVEVTARHWQGGCDMSRDDCTDCNESEGWVKQCIWNRKQRFQRAPYYMVWKKQQHIF